MKFLLVLSLVGFIGVQAQQYNAPAIVIRPPDTTVAETQTARFTCAAYGSPAPTINWRRGNEDLTGYIGADGTGIKSYTQTISVNNVVFSVSVLELCGVNQSSSAQFTCWATNGINFGSSVAPSSATWSLTVTAADQQAPAVVVRPSDQTGVAYGSTVEAVCAAYGNPLPTISWVKTSCQNCDVSEGMGTWATTNEVMSYGDVSFTKSTLRLCNVDPRDSGTFRCMASNGVVGDAIGQASWDFQLSVNDQVATTSSSDVRPTETAGSQVLRNVAAEHAYQAVVGIETVVIVILIVVVIILVFAAYRVASRQEKATIHEMPGFGDRAQATNPIYDEPPRGPGPSSSQPVHVDEMTYADLANRMEDSGGDMKKSLID